jgi:hypothetical protein
MYLDSYHVEVQQLTTLEWEFDSCFHTKYEWTQVFYRLFWLPWRKRSRPEIIGDPRVMAVVIKAEALKRARHLFCTRRPRSVRIVQVERQGALMVKQIIWQNDRWLEE